MLVLTRKAGESLVIDGQITVSVLGVDGERIRLGIQAPPHILVLRQELVKEVQVENCRAARKQPIAMNGIVLSPLAPAGVQASKAGSVAS
ncbi:MAG: carbon storage regulator [Chloroflexota bacterium]|nr:MAG: carbon storage regulator [Chloroflexota bacterium]